jgi:hypothetical protein
LRTRFKLRRMIGTWKQHVRSCRLTHTNMAIAAEHYDRHLVSKGIDAWLNFAVTSAVQFKRDQLSFVGVVDQRTRAALEHWRTRTAELKLEQGQEALAVMHWKARCKRHAWNEWKVRWRNAQIKGRVETFKSEIESKRKLSALAVWMESVVYIKKKRLLAPDVLLRWRSAKLKRVLSAWRELAKDFKGEKEQAMVAVQHWAIAKQAQGFDAWRVQAAEARRYRAQEQVAELHWATRLQQKVMFGWMVFAVERAQESHRRWELNVENKRKVMSSWWDLVVARRRQSNRHHRAIVYVSPDEGHQPSGLRVQSYHK